MKATSIMLFIIAVEIALLVGLKVQEQYREVRYFNNCVEDIKSSKIKSDDPVAFCSGLVRQDPYLFTFNKGKVAKYLKENEPQSSEPKSDKKKETK